MDLTYWSKQTAEKPLFSDLLWSRPETKRLRGKLLVVGGNSQGFMAPAEAYSQALASHVGAVRVLLPQHVQKLFPITSPEIEFLPSTPSGSFAKQSLGEIIHAGEWSDAILLAGDFGRNSETAIMLESLAQKCNGPLTLVQDSLDYFLNNPSIILDRSHTLIVPTLGQLQKMISNSGSTHALTSKIDIINFVKLLSALTTNNYAHICVYYLEAIFVASKGQVSSTKHGHIGEVTLATNASVWWLQHPEKAFESITTSVIRE